MFKGKNILITGGTGSLGRHLVDKLLEYNPNKLIVFSRRDHDQKIMMDEITNPCMRYWIGDIRELDRLRMAFQNVDYVIHTAALKHVDMGEVNPLEYKRTIVDGAENIIQAAIECGVERVIGISTDKACAPYNVYGSCKLMQDKLLMAANSFSKTKFSTIRYGNVIASNGSIVQKLQKSDDNVINITDRTMTRFWISIDFATDLIIHLLKFMSGGELLIPKIPSCNVLEFLKCVKPNAKIVDIPIRDGEKLHESMFTKEDSRMVLEYPDYYVQYQNFPTKNYMTFAGQVGKTIPEFEYCSAHNKLILINDNIKDIINGQYKFPSL